jgi:hypothetical protein
MSDEKAAQPSPSAPKKKSIPAKAEVKREGNGRFLRGNPPGPGAPRKDPELRALCIVETVANVDALKKLRDGAKDPWLRLEAIKVMLQYGFGKPALVGGTPLVNIDMRQQPGQDAAPMTPAEAYKLMCKTTDADASAELLGVVQRPALPAPVAQPASRAEAIDGELVSDSTPSQSGR